LVNVKTIELQPSSQPIVEIPLSELKPGTYKIQAKCNLHGTWEDEIVI
jgi:desulfoferrodoxin (superoxide reductase-like protein)